MHKTTNHRTPAAIVARLIVLVKPMLPIMAAAIVMGVAGHFCATFITIFGGFAILTAAGLQSPLPTVGTAFGCILVFALLRGVLRYAEQASNHYIAFRLLALIRDKVFGALRRLTPAKLEGRDRGDLISLITADIEALEVFYAHTISPVCIAVLWAAGMTAFTAHWHILPALALLAGYLLVGAALPVWSAKRGQAVAREYRQALAKPARPAGYPAVSGHRRPGGGHHRPQRDAGRKADGAEVPRGAYCCRDQHPDLIHHTGGAGCEPVAVPAR